MTLLRSKLGIFSTSKLARKAHSAPYRARTRTHSTPPTHTHKKVHRLHRQQDYLWFVFPLSPWVFLVGQSLLSNGGGSNDVIQATIWKRGTPRGAADEACCARRRSRVSAARVFALVVGEVLGPPGLSALACVCVRCRRVRLLLLEKHTLRLLPPRRRRHRHRRRSSASKAFDGEPRPKQVRARA